MIAKVVSNLKMKKGARNDGNPKQTRAATGDSVPKELYSQSHFVGMQGMQGEFMDPGAFMRKPDAFPVGAVHSRKSVLCKA